MRADVLLQRSRQRRMQEPDCKSGKHPRGERKHFLHESTQETAHGCDADDQQDNVIKTRHFSTMDRDL